MIERVLKTMVEGIHVYKTSKQRSLAVLKKYMRGAGEEILEETYNHTWPGIEEAPAPSLEVIKSALEILSYQYPQAKQTDAAPIIDAAVARRIEQSGFIKALYKR